MKKLDNTTRWIRLGRELDVCAAGAVDDGYEVADFVRGVYATAGVELPPSPYRDAVNDV